MKHADKWEDTPSPEPAPTESQPSGCLRGCFALIIALLAIFVVGAGVCVVNLGIRESLSHAFRAKNSDEAFVIAGGLAFLIVPLWVGVLVYRFIKGKK